MLNFKIQRFASFFILCLLSLFIQQTNATIYCTQDSQCNDGINCTADKCDDRKCKNTFVHYNCNDNNVCTKDTCTNAGCAYKVAFVTACDDGDACTTSDRCSNGICRGTPKICNDNNPCTRDECDTNIGGCSYIPTPGTLCDDKSSCTINDTCNSAGGCSGTVSCPVSSNTCKIQICKENTCGYINAHNGAPCNDGNPCTTLDKCNNGVCVGTGHICDDDNECTQDTCDISTLTCSHIGLPSKSCNDGDRCTKKDKCTPEGICVGEPIVCANITSNPCKYGKCVNGDCKMLPVPSGSTCDDGLKCTTNDICVNSECKGTPVMCPGSTNCINIGCDKWTGTCETRILTGASCNSGSPCALRSACSANGTCVTYKHKCNDENNGDGDNDYNVNYDYKYCRMSKCTPTGCEYVNVNNGTRCNDHKMCTTNDRCLNGICMGDDMSINSTLCNDNNPCTLDTCIEGRGCKHQNRPGFPCDDGNECTVNDTCSTKCVGKCAGGPVSCTDPDIYDCIKVTCYNKRCVNVTLGDNTTCGVPNTNEAFCGARRCVSGVCVLKNQNGSPCNDSNHCTSDDTCIDGACVGTGVNTCNDNNPCTIDSCSPNGGCNYIQAPVGTSCDDGSACTSNDICDISGTCIGINACVPDLNPCTLEQCISNLCVTTNLTDGSSCNDENPCTISDKCDSGICQGDALICDDHIACTVDSCSSGICINLPGPNTQCDDSNPCTLDTCTTSGCQHTIAQGTPCDDTHDCTINDECNALGVCQGISNCTINPDQICFDAVCDVSTNYTCTLIQKQTGVKCTNSSTINNLCIVDSYCLGVEYNDHGYIPGTCLEVLNPCLLDPPAVCHHRSCNTTDGQCYDDPGNYDDPCIIPTCYYNGKCQGSDNGTCVPDNSICENLNTNPCTYGVCTATGCDFLPVPNNTLCNDLNPCTTHDHCNAGVCVGSPVVCNDNNQCTSDSCFYGTGECVYEFHPMQSCDDGNPCTLNDWCIGSNHSDATCVGQSVVECDDGNVCTLDYCNTMDGQCVYPDLSPENQPLTPCDDGNACTTASHCSVGGSCTGTPGSILECNNTFECLSVTCDPIFGCVRSPISAGTPCSSGLPCFLGSSCDGTGSCIGGSSTCNDNNVCTNDVCTINGCLYSSTELIGTQCDDHLDCTANDTCSVDGTCVGLPFICNDNNPCTSDLCTSTGCVHLPMSEGTQCDDPSRCIIGTCNALGQCLGTLACLDNGDPCTYESCSDGACVYIPHAVNYTCDDGNLCTTFDRCDNNAHCVGVQTICNDFNQCTYDSCNITNGQCDFYGTPSEPCSDGIACTENDLCQMDNSCSGVPIICNDNNACTSDSCSTTNGTCIFNPINCDDGDSCTIDTCFQGVCSHIKMTCDDYNPCTFDYCCNGTCIYGSREGFSCESRGTCNENLRCVEPENCIPFPVNCSTINCDDNDPCTTDVNTCVDGLTLFGCGQNSIGLLDTVCAHVALPSCTPNIHHHCITNIECNDNNPCTTDVCNSTSSTCSYSYNLGQCDDGDFCTLDFCMPVDCGDDNSTANGFVSGCNHRLIPNCECSSNLTCRNNINNLCTNAICTDFPCSNQNVSSCTGGKCTYSVVDCDDNERCTIDFCDESSGLCITPPFNCDDGKSCTVDTCIPGPGIFNPSQCNHTVSCDDNNFCTADFCSPFDGSTCDHSTILCDDNNACTINQCHPSSGCDYSVNTDCDDLNPCTIDVCNNVTGCIHSVNTCDDSNRCTIDSCNSMTGCVNQPVVCDDSDPCTTDLCDGIDGICTHTRHCPADDFCSIYPCIGSSSNCTRILVYPLGCNDNNPCTNDYCDPSSGCVHVPYSNPNTVSCDDSDPCTLNDVCTSNSTCQGQNACIAQNRCYTSSCVIGQGCVQILDTSAIALYCNDSIPCTVDSCVNDTTCSHIPNDNACPSSPSQCVAPRCNSLSGCEFVPLTGTNCNDGNPCTTGDMCTNGVCNGNLIDCSDNDTLGNPILCSNDYCDVVTGTCVHFYNISLCEDERPCTSRDCHPLFGCIFHPALDGEQYDCVDNSSCTQDVCHEGSCLHIPITCDDGIDCTIDTCDVTTGSCLSILDNNFCDDGIICTDDECSTGLGCIHTTVNSTYGASICNDNVTCTVDYCDTVSSSCVNMIACQDVVNPCIVPTCNISGDGICDYSTLACNDNNSCTLDSCVDNLGTATCSYTPLNNCNTSNLCLIGLCNPDTGNCYTESAITCTGDIDGSDCTIDQCNPLTGLCENVAMECDDDNLCTWDICNSNGTCSNLLNPCNDSNECTTDTCSAGICSNVFSGANTCTDNDHCTIDFCSSLTKKCESTQNYCRTNSSSLCKSPICIRNAPCTVGVCNGPSNEIGSTCYFSNAANGKVCNDYNECTINDVCTAGVCGGTSILNGFACSDNNTCTYNDKCTGGVCVGTPQPVGHSCASTDQCREDGVCGTANTCTIGQYKPVNSPCTNAANDICMISKCSTLGVCNNIEISNATTCNIGSDITLCYNFSCASGLCVFSSVVPSASPCDDGNPCTVSDVCNLSILKCVGTPLSGSCNDGNSCTTGDLCLNMGLGLSPRCAGIVNATCVPPLKKRNSEQIENNGDDSNSDSKIVENKMNGFLSNSIPLKGKKVI